MCWIWAGVNWLLHFPPTRIKGRARIRLHEGLEATGGLQPSAYIYAYMHIWRLSCFCRNSCTAAWKQSFNRPFGCLIINSSFSKSIWTFVRVCRPLLWCSWIQQGRKPTSSSWILLNSEAYSFPPVFVDDRLLLCILTFPCESPLSLLVILVKVVSCTIQDGPAQEDACFVPTIACNVCMLVGTIYLFLVETRNEDNLSRWILFKIWDNLQ